MTFGKDQNKMDKKTEDAFKACEGFIDNHIPDELVEYEKSLNLNCAKYPYSDYDTPKKYIKQEPYVGDDGIYIPCNDYVQEGFGSAYKMLISKELFVEAYNEWIKGEQND